MFETKIVPHRNLHEEAALQNLHLIENNVGRARCSSHVTRAYSSYILN